MHTGCNRASNGHSSTTLWKYAVKPFISILEHANNSQVLWSLYLHTSFLRPGSLSSTVKASDFDLPKTQLAIKSSSRYNTACSGINICVKSSLQVCAAWLSKYGKLRCDHKLIELATATVVSVVPHGLYLCRLYQLGPGRQPVHHCLPSTEYIIDIIENALVKRWHLPRNML